ncbi:hypothetical protein SBRY_30576 [Actinacidiphila bryophytorum]|uniref:Uncharacterized protein n=1 Tax=Actinacidiphila bryophytorum TaxID=1436133 RepID=A0A9W4MH01_9ACTN|nr:hypothetical protein SBRY_30576 [Actinacidiphila bryophytorum]
MATARPRLRPARTQPSTPITTKSQVRGLTILERYAARTSDLRIAIRRPRVSDRPGFQGHPKQGTPGQQPDLGFTMEPPSGFEPETYALRVRCSGQLS